MSLHLRLTLWHVGVAALVLLVVGSASYTLHVRSLYSDVDQALADDAAILAPVLDVLADAAESSSAPSTPRASSHVRLYDAQGAAIGLAATGGPLPPLSPTEVLAADDGPAYDPVVGLLPAVPGPSAGAFATVEVERGRERAYVLPIRVDGYLHGYVLAWTSLGGVDQSVARFRLLLLGAVGAGLAIATAGGLFVGRVALRPVHDVIATARDIEASRRFDARIQAPPADRHDDLAELVRTLNDMLDTLEEAYRAQQRFVADAAHELRSPITTLRGNLELLGSNANMPEADRIEALRDMGESATRLSTLVDELLHLARSDAGEQLRRVPVPLDEVVLGVVSELRGAADRDRIHVQVEPVGVAGDVEALRRLTTILLDNARKYTPPPERIDIVVRAINGAPVLTVSDRGIGIDVTDEPRVFERFYRGERARRSGASGSGLGLAIARSIVRQHGGLISMKARDGGGTQVTVTLPQMEAAPVLGPSPASAIRGVERPAG